MSAYEAVKAKYGYREISIATWRDPRQSVHPARGGPRALPAISPESASVPFIPYRVKYRPRPPEPTDDEESDEEDRPEPTVEAPADSSQEAQEVPDEKTQESAVEQPTGDMPPGIEEAQESGSGPGPASNGSSGEHDGPVVTSDEAAVALPVIDQSTSEDVPGTTKDNVETVETPDAVAEASNAPAEPDSRTDDAQPATEPLHESDKPEGVESDLEHDVNETAQQSPSSNATQPEDSTAVEEESIIMEPGQEETEPADLETATAEIPPPAPEPPSQADDNASLDDSGEKKVQFAPNTPEPKVTQRKKKNGKSSKSKKSRKSHSSLDDQESPDDIVAIVEGPFDDATPPESAAIVNSSEGGENDTAIVEPVSTPQIIPEEFRAEEASQTSAPDEVVETSVSPEPVETEQAKISKSSKKKSKEKSRDKSKKKSHKGKAKVAENPPIAAGLGIDFGDDSNVAPAVVEASEPQITAAKEVVTEVASNTQDFPPREDARDVEEAQEAQPKAESSPVTTEMIEGETVAASGPSIDEGDNATAPDDEPSREALDSIQVVPDTEEIVDAEGPDQDSGAEADGIEATVSSPIESDVSLEESVGESKSETSPEDDVDIVEGSVAPETTLDSDAPAEETSILESPADQQDNLIKHEDEARELESAGDISDDLDDQDSPKVPDSAIDLDEGSAWDENAYSEPEPEPEPGMVIGDSEKVNDEGALETAVLVEKLDEAAPEAQGPSADDDNPSEDPIIDDKAKAPEPAADILPSDGSREDVEPSQTEVRSPVLDADFEVVATDIIARERTPSIEQLSNATEVGADTDSDSEEDGYSTPHEDDDVATNATVEAPGDPASAADELKDPEVETPNDLDEMDAPIASDLEDSPENEAAEATKSNEGPTGDLPKAIENEDVTSETLGVDIVEEQDEGIPEDSTDPVDPDTVVAASVEEFLSADAAPMEDESKDIPPSNDPPALEIVEAGAVSTTAVTEVVIASANDEEGEPSASLHVEPLLAEEGLTTEIEADQAVPEPEKEIVDEAKSDAQINVDSNSQEVLVAEEEAESPPVPKADLDAAIVVPEVVEAISEDISDPKIPAEAAADAQAALSPERDDEPLPVIEEPAEPVIPLIITDSALPPEEPPSPKLSRSSGSKSKGDRFQTRPSKKHSKDSNKSRDKKSSKEHRERSPEEIAERQRRKDARRLLESSRRLEEERRRFEEEEMKRMRHEVRRAARKAAAEEYERLAREEGEAIARREAERRKKRRVSDVQSMEKRQSDLRPRERRESKTSGGFFGLGGGKSETKAGIFVRTDSGDTSRVRRSRDIDGARTRRVSPPEDNGVEDVPSKRDEPKSASHDGSSSKRRHRRRTESDRAEPRKRDGGERTDAERRVDGRRRTSKPEKPKGFFGSLFSKF